MGNRRIIWAFNLLIITLSTFSQTDTAFWFGAPDVANTGSGAKNGTPLSFKVTAMYQTRVTISRPADPTFIPIEFDLAPLDLRRVILNVENGGSLPISEIETMPMPDLITGIQKKGFLIKSYPGEITCYYDMDNNINKECFVLKGRNALGDTFMISTQNAFDNDANAYGGFVITATADSTVVKVHQNTSWYNFPIAAPTVRTLVMNRGETFAFRELSGNKADLMRGVLVTSNKNIAITVYEDLVTKYPDNACSSTKSNMAGDQTIPVRLTGLEYVVMKGIVAVNPCDGGERAFITIIENGTQLFIDGVALPGLFSAGDVYTLPVINSFIHIRGTKPVYVFHISGVGDRATQKGGVLGGAVLPSIDGCTGSHDVIFDRNGLASDRLLVKIMVRNETDPASPLYNQAINNFTVTINGITETVPSDLFQYIMGGQFAVLRDAQEVDDFFSSRILPGQVVLISNNVARFHLGIHNGQMNRGSKYGYFSDYGSGQAEAGIGGIYENSLVAFCSLDPIRLAAGGGTSYNWRCSNPASATAYITNTSAPAPYFYPPASGWYDFEVDISGPCVAPQTKHLTIYVVIGPTSNFIVENPVGCSPHTVELTNLTDKTYATRMIWEFLVGTPPEQLISNETTVFYTFPPNNTDTIQTYTVRLNSFNGKFCRSTAEQTVSVKPAIQAGFDIDTNMGCQPLQVLFTNGSTGHLDSNSYYWDFGNNIQSFQENVNNTYENFTTDDVVFPAKLVVTSPLGCKDSLIRNITVHPLVLPALSIDSTLRCSPANIALNPWGSKGVDRFYWHITSPTADSLYETASNAPVFLLHVDTTYLSPDTILVNLTGMNRMGCAYVLPERRIIVYPEVKAQFNISKDALCDGDSVSFINMSQGYNLFYNWDFNDGTSFQDTTGTGFAHIFNNRSDIDSTYRVVLTAFSSFFCEDRFDTSIVVHPFIKANFGLDFVNNCTPVHAEFSNLSVGADTYFWNFGDNYTSNISDPAFIHSYWNNSEYNDTTYSIILIAGNTEGCSDTIRRQISILPQVVADFGLTDPTGCSPHTVAFTNNSRGGLLSYLWNFGNGTSSTSPNPLPRNYSNYTNNDTTYMVSLTAINPYGCDSTIYDSVEVFAYINADFNVARADSCSPFVLNIDNLSSAGAHFFEWDLLNSGMGTIYETVPDFGTLVNNGTSTNTYYLRLTAYGANDPEHMECADRDSVKILVYPELNVDFNLDVHALCQPLRSDVQNLSNIFSGTTFQWYIDSTYYSAQADPPDLYINNYTDNDVRHVVRLRGSTNHGCTGEHTDTVTVYSLVEAYFTLNKAGICSGDTFEINRSLSRGGINRFEWDWQSDGIIDDMRSDQLFNYSFSNLVSPAPLVMPVRLTVYNIHGCQSSATRSINVYPQVTAQFTSDDETVCYPHITTFINNSVNAGTFLWDFGDGTGSNSNDPAITHIFANYNNINDELFNIRLIARSPYNCYDTLDRSITVYAKPNAQFYFPTSVDCPPFEATMVNESQGFNLSYLWNFGAGETSTDVNPVHTFSNPGSSLANIPVTLIVTSGRDCKDTVVRVLSVYPDVSVDFTASISEGCSPLTVNFNGQSTNQTNMLWYIDGLAFSTLEDPVYRFQNNTPATRNYEVSFSARSVHGCGDDTTKIITVYSTPSAEFLPDPVLQNYNTETNRTMVTFNNQTLFQNNWSYFWDYGDGNTDDNTSAIFNYYYGDHFWGPGAENGRIPVYLVAWNNENPICRDTVRSYIYIDAPLPKVILEDDFSGCVPLTVDFSAEVDYHYPDSYEWDFGVPGAISTVESPTYTFSEAGIYTVRLIIKGDGGTNWDRRYITVHPKPDVRFSFNDDSVYVGSQTRSDEIITFYNQTVDANVFYWGFNLQTNDYNEIPNYVDTARTAYSTETNPTWYYDRTGEYHVFLIAGSNEGCYDTLIHPRIIYVLGEGLVKGPTGFFVDPSNPRDGHVSDPMDPSFDVFRLYGAGIEKFSLEVYNRWGVLVFTSNDILYGWNGFIDGKPAKQDVYVWRAKGKFTNGKSFEASGDVTLIYGNPK